MADLLQFTATDAGGSSIWLDPDEVESISRDTLGLATFISMKNGVVLHVGEDVDDVSSSINQGRSKANVSSNS